MEPALDERGDPARTRRWRCRSSGRNGARSRRAGRPARHAGQAHHLAAAMEPALDERGDPGSGPESGPGAGLAAMEPALDERGDLAGNVARLDPGAAAMEPALDERGDQAAVPMWIAEVKPQWSPLSTSGATCPDAAAWETSACRNGARSRRAGRPTEELRPVERHLGPQWSPLSTSGATPRRAASPCPRTGRNGARSRRAGRRTGRSTSSATWWGRNGARSRRAGRLGRAGLRADGAAAAAMEPALDERGDYWCDMDDPERQAAAMEPALDERGDVNGSRLRRCAGVPQWSPLSTSGATVPAGRRQGSPSLAAMEPALDERGDGSQNASL